MKSQTTNYGNRELDISTRNECMPPNHSQTILEVIRSHANVRGDHPACTFLTPDFDQTTLTFRELDDRARQLAYRLLRFADPGDRALLMYPAGLSFIESFLGCLNAGIVAVPAYPPRKNRNAARIRAIIEDCRPRTILTQSDMKRKVKESLVGLNKLIPVIATDELDN